MLLLLCGAASAATIKTNQLNKVKMSDEYLGYALQSPAIDGTQVVCVRLQQNNSDHDTIFVKNLKTGKNGRVQLSTQNQLDPDISGSIVVWVEEERKNLSFSYSVYYKNLSSGKSAKVMNTDQKQLNPCISGSIIVWQQGNLSKHPATSAIYYERSYNG